MKPLKALVVVLLSIAATFYLINPGAGIFELIPDNFPFIGNLDEVGATALLLACLRYFGIDPLSLFQRRRPEDEGEGPVIDIEAKRQR